MSFNLDGRQKPDSRAEINNLVMYEKGISSDEMWCKVCSQKRVIMSKAELLSIGLSDIFNQRINEKCDDATGYSFCQRCCNVSFESSSLEPNEWVRKTGAVMCQCMVGQTNQRLTYAPKLMYENQEDENKIARMGEPTTLSQKRWYWYCSGCNHREEMSQSNLTRTYHTENKSFVKSIGTTSITKDPDLPENARLIDDTNIPPPI
jgi:hypothetical protein